jgi:cyclic pyranopterin phosphate synthase
MEGQLTHFDASGKARMVDISDKPSTERQAIARGEIVMLSSTLQLIQGELIKKGDVLTVAQMAGIMAAKKTSDLIPLCHPLQLSHVAIDVSPDINLPGIQIQAKIKTQSNTGVEMEALTAVSVAALTIYDMVKAVDKKMKIQNIRLVEKHGGLSGDIQNE